MEIQISRTVPVALDPVAVRERLLEWAEGNGYLAVGESPKEWEFCRGSNWHAWYTFDVRKIPTRLFTEHSPLDGVMTCSLWCSSWLRVETARLRRTLEEEIDSLAAALADPGSQQPLDLNLVELARVFPLLYPVDFDAARAHWNPPRSDRYTRPGEYTA